MGNKYSNFVILSYYRILFSLLIFFIVFDGIRDSLIFSNYLSYLREATIVITFLSTLRYINFKFKISAFSCSLFMLFFVFVYGLVYSISPVYPELRSISGPLTVLYKHIQFFMLLFCFVNIENLTGKSIVYYAKLMVYMLVFASIITPIVYSHPPAIFKPDFLQWGRMGIGYPTMDAQVFCTGIVILLYMLDFKKIKLNIILGILVLGVLMQVTGTGLFTLFLLFCYFVFLDKKNKIITLAPLVIGLFFLVFFIITSYSDDFSKILWLASDKIDNLMNYGQGQSTQIRHEQFLALFNIIKSSVDFFVFGIGSNVYVENQYSFFFIAFGFVGLACFVVFLLVMMFHGLKFASRDYGVFLLSTVIFSLASYSLVSFYLYSLYSSFAFMMACYIIKRNECLMKFNRDFAI